MVEFERKAGGPLSEQGIEDAKAAAAMRAEEIDFSDIPPLARGWSKTGKRFENMYKARKEAISLRLDADVLVWLRAGGDGYQSRINAILRERMMAEGGR